MTNADASPSAGSVSDTAHWVATYRAIESARADALFRDPFAARLAGTASVPEGVPAWPMIVRTKLIDDLVDAALREGADRIINLAAGLDTRPYRLALPQDLSWIEADLPALVERKERALADEEPRCRLTREKVNLSDPAARAAFLDRALRGATNAVVIAEGLLPYLDDATVASLARALAARAQVRWWITDLMSPGLLRRLQGQTGPYLAEGDRMKFGPPNGVAFFEPLGWRPVDIQTIFRQARILNRLPFFLRLVSYLPEANPRSPGNRPWGAVLRFERAQGVESA